MSGGTDGFWQGLRRLTVVLVLTVYPGLVMEASARHPRVQLGPRPFYLVDAMRPGRLKAALQRCSTWGRYTKRDFSIGHRGAPMQFPEHTKESYAAAARMGAGIIECDVTFTSDGELICRHAQCDLHTTTNILNTELASTCEQPFTPAEFDPVTGERTKAASAKCCASDLTLVEFKSLCGKMDASNENATTVEEFLAGTADWRTDLYSTCGTLLSHTDSIKLFQRLRVKMTPELKEGEAADVQAVFGGQRAYAAALIDDYEEACVRPENVYVQSFNFDDVLYWIENEPAFGEQAVYLDGRDGSIDPVDPDDPGDPDDPHNPTLQQIAAKGVTIIAPPMWVLLTVADGAIAPSKYAEKAKAAGLGLITWTAERSGRIVEDVLEGRGSNFYYRSTDGSSATANALRNDGDILTTLDVLAAQVGVLGVFSDWPATTTFYANCMRLK